VKFGGEYQSKIFSFEKQYKMQFEIFLKSSIVFFVGFQETFWHKLQALKDFFFKIIKNEEKTNQILIFVYNVGFICC